VQLTHRTVYHNVLPLHYVALIAVQRLGASLMDFPDLEEAEQIAKLVS
jgi:hypothetical protein